MEPQLSNHHAKDLTEPHSPTIIPNHINHDHTHTASTKTKFEHQNDINNTLFDYWFFEPLHMPAGVGTAVLKSSVLHQSPGSRLGMSKR